MPQASVVTSSVATGGSVGTQGSTVPSVPTTVGTPETTTTGQHCDQMEYINTLIDTQSVKIVPTDISNKPDLISKGVDLTDKRPSFVIDIPQKGGAIVRDVKLSSTNVVEVEVTFITKSGRETSPIRGAPTSLPTGQFLTEKVVEVVVKVKKTSDDDSPKLVTLSVIACAEGLTTTSTGINLSLTCLL